MIIFCLLSLFIIQKSTPALAAFIDIDQSIAKQDIETLGEKGIFKGEENNQFNPNEFILRQDLVIILARLLHLDLSNPPPLSTYKDLEPDSYAYASVEAAVKNGIISGIGDGLFGVDQNVTREELAAYLVKALNINPKGYGESLAFTDSDAVSDWAKDSVGYAVASGWMKGTEISLFEPQTYATRGQAAW